MSIIKKVFGLFSSKAPAKAKEQDLLEVALEDLKRIKSEKKANDEIEQEAKAKELKMLERKSKLASVRREMESTYDAIEAGRKRVKKIQQRIADLETEEQDDLQEYFERSLARRKQLEVSLWEDEEETPPAHTFTSTAPVPGVSSTPAPTCTAPVPTSSTTTPSSTAPVPGVSSTRKGKGSNSFDITKRVDNPNIN